MNERIKELARQAGFVDKGNNITAYMNFDHEKFAELIVRECMQVTVNYPHPVTKLTAAEHIARHFGVK